MAAITRWSTGSAVCSAVLLSPHRYETRPVEDEQALTEDIVELPSRFDRYGYRRIADLLMTCPR